MASASQLPIRLGWSLPRLPSVGLVRQRTLSLPRPIRSRQDPVLVQSEGESQPAAAHPAQPDRGRIRLSGPGALTVRVSPNHCPTDRVRHRMPHFPGVQPMASSAGLPPPSAHPSAAGSPADPMGVPFGWLAMAPQPGRRQGLPPTAGSGLHPTTTRLEGLGWPGLGARRLLACGARRKAGGGVGGVAGTPRRTIRGGLASAQASLVQQQVLTSIHDAASRLWQVRLGRTRARRPLSPGPG